MKHNAILRNVSFLEVGRSAVGDIYEDQQGRFPDGSQVVTSRVKDIKEVDGNTYICTQNTTYLLDKKYELSQDL